MKLKFPKNFIWGSATSAHQVEGNNTKNDWYQWEEQGHIRDQQKSGLACDHYNRFKNDIDVLKSLNQNGYRLSIEWSRIESEKGKINQKEIEHYREVLSYLQNSEIKSFVTLHHFTSPIWFDWENEKSVEEFANFANLIAKELGGQIDFWCTINEPNILAKHGWLEGDFPPGRRNMSSMFRILDNMIAAHNLAYEKIHKILPSAKVGMAKNNGYYHPASDSQLDKLVTDLNREIRNRYFLDRTTFDFIGINYYSPKKLVFNPAAPNGFYGSKVRSGLPATDMGWEILPEGLYHVGAQKI